MAKILMPDGIHELMSHEIKGLVYFWVENRITRERVKKVEGKVSRHYWDDVVELAKKKFKPEVRFDPKNRGKLL